MIKITICGIAGRMGHEIINTVNEFSDIKIVAGLEISGHAMVGKKIDEIMVYDDVKKAMVGCDCVVDFTNHKATLALLHLMESIPKPFISGSTGFDKHDFESIKEISRKIPIFIAPNMSLGVNTLYELVKYTSKSLSDFDIEIIETHHKLKKDAPSGTAKAILDVVKVNRPDLKTVTERCGITGERKKEELGIFAVRGGDLIGEHRVMFLGSGEFIELRHYATSRRCFARGALAAVRFMVQKQSGFYTMHDLLKAQAGLTNI